ncbi:MAG: hypothetical protein K6T75_07755 [Acetobacteraceae bacterium]|nr:hypothetical protein [Acetobacteraceae bacterium]
MRSSCLILAVWMALVLVLAHSPASAGVSWTKIVEEANILADPFYLEIEDIAVNPLDESQIYLATASPFGPWSPVPPRGLLRSVDGGRTWSEVEGLTQEVRRAWRAEGAPLHVLQVVLNPKDPRQIYVSVRDHGICRSRDGGQTWESVLYNVNEESYNTGGFAYTLDFAVDPREFSRIFAWTRERTLAGRLFFESRDGGDSWGKLHGIAAKDDDSGANGYPGAVRIRMHDHFAEQPADLVLEWSADGGSTWHKTTAGELNPAIGQPGEPAYNVPAEFSFDPHRPRVYGFPGGIPPGLASYWIGTIEEDHMKWEKLDMPDGLGMWGVSFDPQHLDVVYMEVSDRGIRGGPADARMGLHISTDGGRTLVKVPGQPVNAYASVTQVLRKTGATVLYVKLFPVQAFAWTREHPSAGHSTVWRVEIPDSFIRQPQMIITLRIGSREMLLTQGGATSVVPLTAAPVLSEGRLFLPIRPVVEAVGGQIAWDPTEERVDITGGGRRIALWIGRSTALVNGQEMAIDPLNPGVRPFLPPPGVTLLPLRFVSEALGAGVEWDGATGTAVITYPAERGGPE